MYVNQQIFLDSKHVSARWRVSCIYVMLQLCCMCLHAYTLLPGQHGMHSPALLTSRSNQRHVLTQTGAVGTALPGNALRANCWSASCQN